MEDLGRLGWETGVGGGGGTCQPGDVGFEAKMCLKWDPMSWGEACPLGVAGDSEMTPVSGFALGLARGRPFVLASVWTWAGGSLAMATLGRGSPAGGSQSSRSDPSSAQGEATDVPPGPSGEQGRGFQDEGMLGATRFEALAPGRGRTSGSRAQEGPGPPRPQSRPPQTSSRSQAAPGAGGRLLGGSTQGQPRGTEAVARLGQ